jgi:hypothetical protein
VDTGHSISCSVYSLFVPPSEHSDIVGRSTEPFLRTADARAGQGTANRCEITQNNMTISCVTGSMANPGTLYTLLRLPTDLHQGSHPLSAG